MQILVHKKELPCNKYFCAKNVVDRKNPICLMKNIPIEADEIEELMNR